MRKIFLTGACLTALLAGCQQTAQPSDKIVAAQHWNEARSTVLASLARDQYHNGSFDKCRQTIDEALRMTPHSAPLHILSGKVALEQGQLELAQREFQQAAALAPTDPEPLYLSGIVCQRWQRFDAALTFYRAASARAPAELSYLLAQAEMLQTSGRTADALVLLQGKVAYFANSGAIRDAVGQLLMQLGEFHEAADAFQQASILSDGDDGIRERLALAQYHDGQYRAAADGLTALLAKDAYSKRGDLFAMQGECLLRLNRARDARDSFEQATQLDPHSAPQWLGLARAAMQLNDVRRCEWSCRKAVQLDKSSADAHLLLGYALLKDNQFGESLAAFDAACLLAPRDAVSWCMAGYVNARMGRAQKARTCYQTALKASPKDEMAERLLASLDERP